MFDKISAAVDTLFIPYAEAFELTCKIFVLCLPFIIGYHCLKFLVHYSHYIENRDDD